MIRRPLPQPRQPGEMQGRKIPGVGGQHPRIAIKRILQPSSTLVGQPLSTLAINVVGSFALGLLVARLWSSAAPWLRAGLGAGLLGSFTTFSAVAVTLVHLGVSWSAALYLALTLALGLAGAWAGLRIGRRS